jgi:hypothetical protein
LIYTSPPIYNYYKINASQRGTNNIGSSRTWSSLVRTLQNTSLLAEIKPPTHTKLRNPLGFKINTQLRRLAGAPSLRVNLLSIRFIIEDMHRSKMGSGRISHLPNIKDINYRIILSLTKGNSYQGIVITTFQLDGFPYE